MFLCKMLSLLESFLLYLVFTYSFYSFTFQPGIIQLGFQYSNFLKFAISLFKLQQCGHSVVEDIILKGIIVLEEGLQLVETIVFAKCTSLFT